MSRRSRKVKVPPSEDSLVKDSPNYPASFLKPYSRTQIAAKTPFRRPRRAKNSTREVNHGSIGNQDSHIVPHSVTDEAFAQGSIDMPEHSITSVLRDVGTSGIPPQGRRTSFISARSSDQDHGMMSSSLDANSGLSRISQLGDDPGSLRNRSLPVVKNEQVSTTRQSSLLVSWHSNPFCTQRRRNSAPLSQHSPSQHSRKQGRQDSQGCSILGSGRQACR